MLQCFTCFSNLDVKQYDVIKPTQSFYITHLGMNVKQFYLLLYSIALRTLSLSPVNIISCQVPLSVTFSHLLSFFCHCLSHLVICLHSFAIVCHIQSFAYILLPLSVTPWDECEMVLSASLLNSTQNHQAFTCQHYLLSSAIVCHTVG